jgi:hypothetical protein
MGTEPILGDGVDPYESIGAIAAARMPGDDSALESGDAGGFNPYEHGSFSPERAWDTAGLDTRDIDAKKSTWLAKRLARGKESSPPGGFGRRRR